MADDDVRQKLVAVAVFVYFDTMEEFRRGSSRSTSFFFLVERERFRSVINNLTLLVCGVKLVLGS